VAREILEPNVSCTNSLKMGKGISGNAWVDGAAETIGAKAIRVDSLMNNGRLVAAYEKLTVK